MKIAKGTRVLITGGASGIGKIMGRLALEKGAELIIWDVNKKMADETAAEFARLGKVTTYQVDISNMEQVTSVAHAVKANQGGVDLLINNAGIVVGKLFQDHSIQDITRTMDINSLAPMAITRHFLPGMLDQKKGHICNIASSAGLTSNPRMSVYVASKWSLTGWSDSLRIEMEQQKTGVGVTTVTPYYINTGMFDGVRSPLIPIQQPEKAARKIIRGIEHDKIFVSMPWSVHFVRLTQGLLPFRVYDLLAGRVLGIYNTMEHFTGRKS
ncbi:MAG: SDR family oxidoreductase [Bacteroidales bacterium]|nr:SDR family oxidoreductase [Bacteroidales bacterium]